MGQEKRYFGRYNKLERLNDFQGRMKEARERAGLSIKQAAVLIGVANIFLYKVENGSAAISSEKIVKACEVYGVAYDWVVSGRKHDIDMESFKSLNSDDQKKIRDLLESLQ